MSITLNDMLGWWPHISAFGGFALMVMMWRLRGEFATKGDLASLSTETAKLSVESARTGARMAAVEHEMQLLPTRQDIHTLQLSMMEIKGSLSEMRAEARADRALLARLDGALIRHEDIISATGRSERGHQ